VSGHRFITHTAGQWTKGQYLLEAELAAEDERFEQRGGSFFLST
jgi:hypothetical protein